MSKTMNLNSEKELRIEYNDQIAKRQKTNQTYMLIKINQRTKESSLIKNSATTKFAEDYIKLNQSNLSGYAVIGFPNTKQADSGHDTVVFYKGK